MLGIISLKLLHVSPNYGPTGRQGYDQACRFSKSRVNREIHARFRESGRGKFLPATRPRNHLFKSFPRADENTQGQLQLLVGSLVVLLESSGDSSFRQMICEGAEGHVDGCRRAKPGVFGGLHRGGNKTHPHRRP